MTPVFLFGLFAYLSSVPPTYPSDWSVQLLGAAELAHRADVLRNWKALPAATADDEWERFFAQTSTEVGTGTGSVLRFSSETTCETHGGFPDPHCGTRASVAIELPERRPKNGQRFKLAMTSRALGAAYVGPRGGVPLHACMGFLSAGTAEVEAADKRSATIKVDVRYKMIDTGSFPNPCPDLVITGRFVAQIVSVEEAQTR